MRFLTYCNVTRQSAVAFGERITRYLSEKGHQCFAFEELSSPDMIREAIDAALIIGGDGTMLRAVRQLYGYGFPFWGINLGHVGYMTESEPDTAFEKLDQITKGEYRLEKRIMVEAQLGDAVYPALNEVVIHRSGYMRSLNVSFSVSGTEIGRFSGDGLMVSTPTGSTGYNLSNGGPILLPEANHLVIAPICPQTVPCAPIVISGDHEVAVTVAYETPKNELVPQLTFDSCESVPVQSGDVIRLKTMSNNVSFIKTGETEFFRKLQMKMILQNGRN